jgi:predicted Rossmann fold flavoprotein
VKNFDVVIIGAGGAGLMCAIEAGKRGRRVALLDHGPKVGAKILISGGGRCNFTNTGAGPGNYVSRNPHFCKSALSRYTPEDFIGLVRSHHIPFHEKKLGQLFCDRSAKDIVEMLVKECEKAGVEITLGCKCEKVIRSSPPPLRGEGQGEDEFHLTTTKGDHSCASLVIATGGLSIPKVGATDFGYRIARQFGLGIVEPSPALDGFRFTEEDTRRFGDLTGVSVDSLLTCNGAAFRENVLFTHAGLSGPAALQASLYWNPGDAVTIDFLPDFKPGKLEEWFLVKKERAVRSEVKTLLSELLPHRLAEALCGLELPPRATLPQLSDKAVSDFAFRLQHFTLFPSATIGFSKAEVTRGGVDTDGLSSKTMECKEVKGLYFIGEVVDVTGWLGGYNFQWAWSFGWAAGQAV